MQPPKRFFLIALLSLALVLTGGTWYALQCATQMGWGPFTGPQHAHAEQKYTCGMHPMIITDEPGTCPICGMDLTPLKTGTAGAGAAGKPKGERKIKYWVAPMDPTYIRDEPGKSPMGMDLVPVYEDEAAGGSVISIDPVVQQNMGVRTAPVELRDLHRTIRTVGLVAYDEPQQFSINAKIDGWIERLHVDQTGQVVKKGHPLLELYSPKLVSAQEEYLLALRNRNQLKNSSFSKIAEGGESLLEASRKRLKYWDISDRQIRDLERTGEVKKTLTLYSPFEGIVKRKMAYEGQYVKSGQELFQLADISEVWVYADIYEYELPWIKVGQKASVSLPYVDGEDLEAQITYIYPYVEPKTRTVKARLEFENSDFELKPDMYVNVRINGQEVKNALTVPVESVIHSGEKKTVFVALGDGRFEPRHVRTGLQNKEGYIEIKQGLLEGERIVTSAQFMFDSESKLREAIQKMMTPQEGDPSAQDARDAPAEEMDEQTEEENLEDLF
ncbi:MAG: efflux RND transporter periplasmic adaptor subunit [Thermodesulfobacteriota bacterium]|nr:efflux RND transporter periplasmic adaptor subunit [Thermodesulfobacteriota bacterium]